MESSFETTNSLVTNLPKLLYFQLKNCTRNECDDDVEQPVDLNTITHRLVDEGQQFLRKRATDSKPFLLFMSWLQVHTALHADERFK